NRLSRQRRRRDVAARLRFSEISRRPDVLGRRHRRESGVRTDRPLAPAFWRALGTVEAAARTRGKQHAVPRGQTRQTALNAGKPRCMINKTVRSMAEAMAGIKDGS